MVDLSDVVSRPILVVDDSDDDFDTVVEAASRARVRNPLVHAADADVAQRLLDAPGSAYAFMLLDYNLPGVDGLAFLRGLRRHGQHAMLPTVVLTASVNPRDRDAFYAAGANAFHVKVVRFDESLRSLEVIFNYWLAHATLPDTGRATAADARP